MSDHADTVRDAIWRSPGWLHAGSLAALDALVAERDALKQDALGQRTNAEAWKQSCKEAEARVTELEAAMRQILDGEDPIRVARKMDDVRAALAAPTKEEGT
jgi:hypothetical protein